MLVVLHLANKGIPQTTIGGNKLDLVQHEDMLADNLLQVAHFITLGKLLQNNVLEHDSYSKNSK